MKLTYCVSVFALLFFRVIWAIDLINSNDIEMQAIETPNNASMIVDENGPFPVVIIHGIMTGAPSMQLIKDQIELVSAITDKNSSILI